jgi:hypothetical protein
MLSFLIPAALAYGERVHTTLTEVALKPMGFEQPAELDAAAMPQIRALIDTRARNHPDAAIREAWIKRYPTPENFDAWAFKEFLLLAPGSEVFGADKVASAPNTLALLTQASRQPDDDRRNYDRLAYDTSRQPLKDAKGNPVPADPAILNMGKLGVLSSQAHAHYGLAQVEFTDDSDVLKSDPKRFAVAAGYAPGPILTLAAEMNQIHLDLALIAASSGAPGAEALAWSYAGNGYHYLEDVGNQIHTVQVGLFDFFMDAFKDRMWMSVKTCGGHCGELRSLASIGIDILTNHHTLSEYLTEKRLMEAVEGKDSPEGKRLLAAITAGDPEFEKTLDTALAGLGADPSKSEFGITITRTLIAVSAEEGDDVYRATRAIALPQWRKEGVLYDYAHADPDEAVYPNDAKHQKDYEAFWALQEKAFKRVGVVLRKEATLQRAWMAAATGDALAEAQNIVIDRLVARQLKMLEEAEKRRQEYIQNPPVSSATPETMPGMLAVEVGIPTVVGSAIYRRRKTA